MAYNFKQQVTAKELQSILAIRLNTTRSDYVEVGGEPVVQVLSPEVAGLGGASVRVLDQRGAEDVGWKNIVGVKQTVFTTGVAQILTESQGNPSVISVRASQTFTIGGGADAPAAAGVVITVGSVALTEGVEWAAGANDQTSATALANAINADATLNKFVFAVATLGGALADSVVTVTAHVPGTIGNQIVTTSSGASVVAGGATLTSGAGGPDSSYISAGKIATLIAECGIRGLKVELWQVPVGTAPVFANFGSAVKVGDFDTQLYWPLSGRV